MHVTKKFTSAKWVIMMFELRRVWGRHGEGIHDVLSVVYIQHDNVQSTYHVGDTSHKCGIYKGQIAVANLAQEISREHEAFIL